MAERAWSAYILPEHCNQARIFAPAANPIDYAKMIRSHADRLRSQATVLESLSEEINKLDPAFQKLIWDLIREKAAGFSVL